MASFLDGQRLKPVSEMMVHLPIGQTRQFALKGHLDAREGELVVSVQSPHVCNIVSSSIRKDVRMLVLRGQGFGQARVFAKTAHGGLRDFFDVHVHKPRLRQLPSFGDLTGNYAGDEEPSEDFLSRTGVGKDPNIKNTCVLRVSEAFNKAGHRIPKGLADLKTVASTDGLTLALRVAEFKKYLLRTYGQPDITVGVSPPLIAGVKREAFEGLMGVMCFEAKFSDATGHFTLWDGTRAVHGDYFDRSHQVSLWIAE